MKNTSKILNVLPQLQQLGFDDHEAIAALQSAKACRLRRTEGRTYELISGKDIIGKVQLNKRFRLSSIAMPDKVWKEIQPSIEADATLDQTRIARFVLFSYRAPTGFARVPGWLQLRPVACPLGDITPVKALTFSMAAVKVPRPFAVEVVYRYSGLLFLEAYRRLRAVQEAKWLLSAFIDVPVFDLNNPYSWAFLNGEYHLVLCGMETGLENASEFEFSEIGNLSELTPVANSQYFSELGVATTEFRVPELHLLRAKYLELSHEERLLFLRSCASLAASYYPTLGASQILVALVSAIEPLLGEAKRCEKCGSLVGITEQFRKFLDQYVQPSPEVRDLYEKVYEARSKILHGGWNFELDEFFLGSRPLGDDVLLAAWDATKRGVVNWLLSKQANRGKSTGE